MLRRFLLSTIAVSALAGTCSTAQEISEVKAQSRFDYSPLTETEPDEIAQAQQIASEDQAPGVVAAEAAGPDQAALAKAVHSPAGKTRPPRSKPGQSSSGC